VDEKRFESEIRRVDTTLADERENREKFETRIEKSMTDLRGEMKDLRGEMRDLRGEMKDLRGEMYAGFDKLNDKMDNHFKWMMGFLVGSAFLRYFIQ
jgi:predicted  nucleic acid-binding Zn-ribbon protein